MRLKKLNILILSVILIFSTVLSTFAFNSINAFALSPIDGVDGKYSVDFDTSVPDNPVMRQVFEDKKAVAIVEKFNNNFYLTLSLNSVFVSDFTFMSENGKVGEIIRRDDNIERHTYTVTKENLQKTLNFSLNVHVAEKVMFMTFTIDLRLNSGKWIDNIDDLGERPALFQPEIKSDASDVELETGSLYIVKKATGSFENADIDVKTNAYYINNGNKEPVEIENGKILLSKVGEYHLIYRAESNKYKTSLGNNTYCEKDIKIISRIGATSISKVEDINNILPDGYMISSNYVNTGDNFSMAKNKMKKIADNFQVISFEIYSVDGNLVDLSDDIVLELRTDDYFDRHNVSCYYMDEGGNLTEIATENYGRYTKLKTDKTGNYILYVPGVAFVMPMWGYIVIAVVSLLVVAGVITTVVVVAVKRKKKAENNN